MQACTQSYIRPRLKDSINSSLLGHHTSIKTNFVFILILLSRLKIINKTLYSEAQIVMFHDFYTYAQRQDW